MNACFDKFGPWVPVTDPGERMARFRMLAGLVAIYIGSWHPLVGELIGRSKSSTACLL